MNALALLSLLFAAFAATANASKEDFPLVWVCLGITVAGVIVVLVVAYLRPAELHLPGMTVMTAQENESGGGLYEEYNAEETSGSRKY